MSFGYSIGDGLALVQLAYHVLEGARKACGEHDDLTREVASLHKVLQRLRKELVSPDSLLNRADDERGQELDEHCKGVEALLKVMDDVITRYNLLSNKDGKKAALRLWQKIKFGNTELKDVAAFRLKVATYTSAISMSLNLCSLGSQGRVEKELRDVGGGLEGITAKLDWIAANITAKNGDGTIWTNYNNDDRTFWRQLRRDLINEGYHSKVLVKHKDLLKSYVAELGQRGAFDEVSSGEDTDRDDDGRSDGQSRGSVDNEAWSEDDGEDLAISGTSAPHHEHTTDVETSEPWAAKSLNTGTTGGYGAIDLYDYSSSDTIQNKITDRNRLWVGRLSTNMGKIDELQLDHKSSKEGEQDNPTDPSLSEAVVADDFGHLAFENLAVLEKEDVLQEHVTSHLSLPPLLPPPPPNLLAADVGDMLRDAPDWQQRANLFRKYKIYYPKYEALHKDIAAMAAIGQRNSIKEKDVVAMHARLEDMMKSINMKPQYAGSIGADEEESGKFPVFSHAPANGEMSPNDRYNANVISDPGLATTAEKFFVRDIGTSLTDARRK